MSPHFPRPRSAALAAAGFIAGAVFVSGMHFTRRAEAQSLAPIVPRPSAIAGTPADFSAVAARVTPAVVSIIAQHDAHPVADRGRRPDSQIPPEIQRFFQFQSPDGSSPFAMPDPQQQARTASGSGFIVSPEG